ncbi:unnamed protein product [Discula destructiva]
MASNDGQKLLVFGLGFAQHDSRKMQQVLRHYDRMPSTPGSRAALFVELTKLGKELDLDEIRRRQAQQITDWMTDGGDFPLGVGPPPLNAAQSQYRSPAAPPYFSQINNQYGPGHVLTFLGHDDGGTSSEISAPVPQNNPAGDVEDAVMQSQDGNWPEEDRSGSAWGAAAGSEANGEYDEWDPAAGKATRHSGRAFNGSGAQLEEDNPEEDDHEDEEPHQMDAYRWAPAPAALDGPFRGRGRTFDDIDESAVTTANLGENSLPFDVLRPNSNRDVPVPRLRADQMWRGNNVRGLGAAWPTMPPGRPQGFGGLPMGMMGHQGRGNRPRMEHDLEEEEDLDDRWGAAPGHFALGPGRALNDPEPAPAEEPVHDSDTQEALSDTESIYAKDDEEQSLPRSPEDDDNEPIECPICLEEYPPSGFPKRPLVTDQCDHPDKACLRCLDSSITTVVETGALHILACPLCPQKLSRREVKEYAKKKVYKRYKYLKQQALIPGHYISCTNPACGGSQAHDSNGPSGPQMACKFCQFETCAKHRRPWHRGQTCVEFDMDPIQMERLEEEEATAKLLASEDTSICPKCGQGVTKTDGCDHMMCQCGTEWCYVCSCSWENILRIGATAHSTFCIYHPNKVNLTKTQRDAARDRIMGLVHGGEVSPELTRARDEFRQRRREEMRPKLAEAAEARMKQQHEQQQQKRQGSFAANGQARPKKTKFKLMPAWEEGGTTKRGL